MLENQIPTMPVLIKDLGMIFANELSTNKYRYGIYRCSCGEEFRSRSTSIKNKTIKSCGCYNKLCTKNRFKTHGLSSHKIYGVWHSMVERCTNSNDKGFKNYGGRGITVCSEWLKFENFRDDMLPTWVEGLSIDRINTNGCYELSNCRWTTRVIQNRNMRKIISTNKSGYRGVCFNKRANKWQSNICVNLKRNYLGLFMTALDAAKAYDKYVIDNNLEHTINGVL